MGEFLIPDGPTPLPAPPPDPMVAREEKIANDTRVEQALNSFLTAKQGALFDAPDAFYRAQGEDAIHAAPVVTKNLDQLRGDLVDGLGNDYQRQRLGAALDAQMQLTRDGMARHVAEQSLAWQRGVAQDRIALLTKEAAQHHNDTDLVDALGHAAATAARAHSRVGDGPPGGEAEDAAAAQARSGVLGAAIQARLDRGDTQGANALFTQVQDQLDPAHAVSLQGQMQIAQPVDNAESDPAEPDVETAQSIPPFLGKPPYYVPARPPGSGSASGGPKAPGPETPKGPPQAAPKGESGEAPRYKVPVPRQSGKEGSKNIPSWEKGETVPFEGEKGAATAKRAMDKKYPDGWSTKSKEYRELKKHYERHYRDPKPIEGVPVPSEGPYGIPGAERAA